MERIFQYTSNSWFAELFVVAGSTPQGWMLEQPVVLVRPFNTSEQQFSTLEPLGLIATRPTPQGWMEQQPNSEIFIRGFNSTEQQFFTLTPVTPNVFATLLVIDADDTLVATANDKPGPIVLATMVVTGVNCDAMQLLGYSATEFLFYDEPNTQSFYLKQTSKNTVLKVSPAFAKFWLVDSGRLRTLVYNPFEFIQNFPLSNVL